MPAHQIRIHNDMGHLMITDPSNKEDDWQSPPKHISNYVMRLIRNKVFVCSDKETNRACYHCLDPRLKNKWAYWYDKDTTVTISYELYKYDPERMTLPIRMAGGGLVQPDLTNYLIANYSNLLPQSLACPIS